jgi:hypothetical protein
MAKQIFLSPVVGTGGIDDPYRPSIKAAVDAVNAARPGFPSSPALAALTSWMPVDPANGRPLRTWCICIVAAKDLRPFQAVAGTHPIPVLPLDVKVTAAGLGKLQALLNKLDALGIDKSFAVNPDGSIKADAWREVIRGIGKAAGDTSFDENNFDAVDIA